MFRNSIHTFKNLSETGVDQVPVNGIIQVIDADTTQTNKVGFVQLISKSGIDATTTVEEVLTGLKGDVRDIVQSDSAGKLYNPEKKYTNGDIVTQETQPGVFTTYIAITNTSGTFDPTAWEDFAKDLEYRGKKWDAGKKYTKGDIVSHEAGIGNVHIFIARQDNTNADPITSIQDWASLDNIEYHVATHTPTPGVVAYGDTEYPNSTVVGTPPTFIGRPGATWTIDGLLSTGYTMTQGSLAGVTVHNNDKFVWMGDVDTPNYNVDDLWNYRAAPTIAGEIGGVLWNSTANYQTGAIVSYAGQLFVSNQPVGNTSTTLPPPQDTTNWTLVDENVTLGKGTTQGQYLGWDVAGTGSWKLHDAPSFIKLTDTPNIIPANQKVITDNTGTHIVFEDDTFNSLDDVDVTTPTIDDVITYQSGTLGNKWVNSTISSVAGKMRLQDLKDVTTPAGGATNDGFTVSWNSTASGGIGNWDLKKIPNVLSDLTDVSYTALTVDDLLIYTNTGFQNINLNDLYVKLAATGKLTDIGNVNLLPTIKDGDTILWNDTTKVWETKELVIPTERGGLIWDATTSYKVGDIVTVAGQLFISMINQLGGPMPTVSNANWQKISAQVQSDFNETDPNSPAFILNQPTNINSGSL